MWLLCAASVSGDLPVELKAGEYIVGRSRSAQIRINDRTISKEHAHLVCLGKVLSIEDLDSLNHTFVNGRQVKSAQAEVGDEVQFGAVRCRLSIAPLKAEADETLSTARVLRGDLPPLADAGLTPAQQEVLRLVLQGLDEATIGQRLGRSGHTVHTHVKAIFKQVGVHSRTELVAKLLSGKGFRSLP